MDGVLFNLWKPYFNQSIRAVLPLSSSTQVLIQDTDPSGGSSDDRTDILGHGYSPCTKRDVLLNLA